MKILSFDGIKGRMRPDSSADRITAVATASLLKIPRSTLALIRDDADLLFWRGRYSCWDVQLGEEMAAQALASHPGKAEALARLRRRALTAEARRIHAMVD